MQQLLLLALYNCTWQPNNGNNIDFIDLIAVRRLAPSFLKFKLRARARKYFAHAYYSNHVFVTIRGELYIEKKNQVSSTILFGANSQQW